jgi:hypothetical protein
MSDVIWSTTAQGGQETSLVELEKGLYELTLGAVYDSGNTGWFSLAQLEGLFKGLKEIFEPDICTVWAPNLLIQRNADGSSHHTHKCIKHAGHKPVEARTPTHECACGCSWTNSLEGMEE